MRLEILLEREASGRDVLEKEITRRMAERRGALGQPPWTRTPTRSGRPQLAGL